MGIEEGNICETNQPTGKPSQVLSLAGEFGANGSIVVREFQAVSFLVPGADRQMAPQRGRDLLESQKWGPVPTAAESFTTEFVKAGERHRAEKKSANEPGRGPSGRASRQKPAGENEE